MRDECCGAEVRCDDCPVTDRSAVSDRREQVAGFVRPQQVGSAADLREQVAEVREIPDLYKVYHREWLVVASSDLSGEEGRLEAEAYFQERYADRVYPEHVRVVAVSQTSPGEWPYRLELCLPNQRGEFKHRELAEVYVREMGWQGDPDTRIVPRNSREEHQILDYSRKKLRARE